MSATGCRGRPAAKAELEGNAMTAASHERTTPKLDSRVAATPAQVFVAKDSRAALLRLRRAISTERSRVPRMRFAARMTAPSIQRIVDHHAVFQHLVVVAIQVRQPERNRQQPWGLWRQVGPRRIGASHDNGELGERRIIEAILAQERIETAQLADMAQLDVRHVVWNRAPVARRRQHVRRRNVQKLGLAVDKARDQPRTRDAIDLRPFSRHPFHGGSLHEFNGCRYYYNYVVLAT